MASKSNNQLLLIITMVVSFYIGLLSSTTWAQDQNIPIISTRGHFDLDTGMLNTSHSTTNFTRLNVSECYPQLIVFVHGYGSNDSYAREKFERTLLSLQSNGFNNTLVGFSWDSNSSTIEQDLNWMGWNNAKKIASENGPKLANYIIENLEQCKLETNSTEIRLIGHSLGARVILSALESLHDNERWTIDNNNITSVHLLGAAVDNEEVTKNLYDILSDPTNIGTIKSKAFGNPMEYEVTDFYNLYSSNDNYLEPKTYMQIYPSYESGDLALGQSGFQQYPYSILTSLPNNYHEINVRNEILPICDADRDGILDSLVSKGELMSPGDNHNGYMGYMDASNKTKLMDDGVMNIVVDNWNHIPSTLNRTIDETIVC
jgi:pimeloyl-ACP methyl ester carboxylesterase